MQISVDDRLKTVIIGGEVYISGRELYEQIHKRLTSLRYESTDLGFPSAEQNGIGIAEKEIGNLLASYGVNL